MSLMHKTKSKEPNWKQSLRNVADNPDFIFDQMEGMRKELSYDDPDPSYLREKHRNIGLWIDEIAKFHTAKGVMGGSCPRPNVKVIQIYPKKKLK